MIHPFTSVIISAAGKGTRMNTCSDKLMVPIGGKSVLERTILSFQKAETTDEIIVVTREDLIDTVLKIKEENNLFKVSNVVKGGPSRAESVLNGIEQINKKSLFISVHDGARPFIKPEKIDEIHLSGYEYGAVCCGTKPKNTIKIIDKNGFVLKTPDRNTLFSVATPQIFSKKIYLDAIQKVGCKIAEFTDDSGIVESAGYKVKTVLCGDGNIKITTDEDLIIAETLVKYYPIK